MLSIFRSLAWPQLQQVVHKVTSYAHLKSSRKTAFADKEDTHRTISNVMPNTETQPHETNFFLVGIKPIYACYLQVVFKTAETRVCSQCNVMFGCVTTQYHKPINHYVAKYIAIRHALLYFIAFSSRDCSLPASCVCCSNCQLPSTLVTGPGDMYRQQQVTVCDT